MQKIEHIDHAFVAKAHTPQLFLGSSSQLLGATSAARRLSLMSGLVQKNRAVAQDRVKQIDVMWLDSGRIMYEFEVENTTGISVERLRKNLTQLP